MWKNQPECHACPQIRSAAWLAIDPMAFWSTRLMDELEPGDRRILAALQRDGRLSNQALADEVGMSTSACWRRVRQLEQQGIITRYAALLDVDKAGFQFAALVMVTLSRHDASEVTRFISAVRDRPEVLDCYAVTGEADYHLRVVCRDKAAYNRFLDEFMFRLPGLAHVRTQLILSQLKSSGPLPV